MFNQRILILFLIIVFCLSACNLPSSTDEVHPPSDVQTAAALTLQAILTPSVTPKVQAPLLADSPTPTVGPTGTITPTYSVPILKILEQTNCRSGPGQDYVVLFTYVANVSLEIIGRYEPTNFWLVKSNESQTGECWLWGEYAETTGSYWVVPSVTPPPTATAPPPKAPSVLWDYFCSYANNQINVTLNWTDIAANEIGYRVIRNGQQVAELPANSTTFNETIALVAGETTSYQVEVYNLTSSTRSAPISFKC